jgi:hypothetical protein
MCHHRRRPVNYASQYLRCRVTWAAPEAGVANHYPYLRERLLRRLRRIFSAPRLGCDIRQSTVKLIIFCPLINSCLKVGFHCLNLAPYRLGLPYNASLLLRRF